MADWLAVAESGIGAAQKGAGLLQQLLGLHLPKREEARRAYMARLCADETLSDDELIDKILDSGARVREAQNKRKILKKAAAVLDGAEPDPACAPQGMDEDWAAYFFDRAKNVSSDEVQVIWARLLAAECQNAGSVHRKVIDTLALLDAATAKSFSALCRLTFSAPGVIHDRKAKSVVPLVIPSSELYKIIRHFNLADLSGIDHMHYTETAKDPALQLPFCDYCALVPSFPALILLEELGLVRLFSEAPRHSFLRDIACTSGEPDKHFDVNRYKCCGQTHEIICPSGDFKDWGDGSGSNVTHRIPVGYVEYTSIGKHLYHTITEETLPSLPALIKLYYEQIGYTVKPL